MAVEILAPVTGEVVARGKNLGCILRYATKHGVAKVGVAAHNWPDINGGGELLVEFGDGACVATDFADYRVLVDFVSRRSSWRGAELALNGHKVNGGLHRDLARMMKEVAKLMFENEEEKNG